MNDIIQAIRANPTLLNDIVTLPEYHLNTHNSFAIERAAFQNINFQAFGKRRFSNASENRHRTYRNYLGVEERYALRLERKYMLGSVLRGQQLQADIARCMSIRFKSHYTWRDVKGILEFASEVIADIELSL